MIKATRLHRLLLNPPGLRACILPRTPILSVSISRPYSAIQDVTSFWKSLIPKPLRKSSQSTAKAKQLSYSKEWNPATFFIVAFMLIGSMSIQMIALKNNFAAFSRRADAKIELLREIIERIQKGEDVDVEGLLGTGDARKEQEWEEVLREIEEEDQAWEQSRKPKPKHGLAESKGAGSIAMGTGGEVKTGKEKEESKPPSGFY